MGNIHRKGKRSAGLQRRPPAASPTYQSMARRVEVRSPDPMANPYYDLPKEELKTIPAVCGSLREHWKISTRTAASSGTAACTAREMRKAPRLGRLSFCASEISGKRVVHDFKSGVPVACNFLFQGAPNRSFN